jgi:hypothetical protein
MVTGLFMDPHDAERAYQACLARGYEIGDVNALMSDTTRQQLLADPSQATDELAHHKAEGGELGGPKGGRLSILISIVAAVGAALTLPALGLVVAGPVAAALTAAGAAGLAAGVLGAVAHWGLPAERVREYEAGIRDGGILMGVKARSKEDARQIEGEWKALGGRHVYA